MADEAVVRGQGFNPRKAPGGIVKETVVFHGTVVGEGHRVDCKVRATKTTIDLDPDAPPEFSDYEIMDSAATVRLPDGDYQVLVNAEKLRCKLNRGRFLWRL